LEKRDVNCGWEGGKEKYKISVEEETKGGESLKS